MKKYPRQVGPNLVFWDIDHAPSAAVLHKQGCGGMLVQNMGSNAFQASIKPENTPGKVYCLKCGHKVGKQVVRALKTLNSNHNFYFPGHEEFELQSQVFVDKGQVLRYWEWVPREVASKKGTPRPLVGLFREPFKIKFPNKRPRTSTISRSTIPRPPSGVGISRPPATLEKNHASQEWIIKHPKITVRLPTVEFSAAQAAEVHRAFIDPAHSNASARELQQVAAELVGGDIEAVKAPIIQRPNKFVILHSTSYVLMDARVWSLGEAEVFRDEIVGKDLLEVISASVDFSIHNDHPDMSIVAIKRSAVSAESFKFPKAYGVGEEHPF